MPKNAFKATYETALKQIFNTCRDRLYGYVLAVSHSTCTTEEITREIFMKRWFCRDAFSSTGNNENYILTIARNNTLNHPRQANNQAALLQKIQSHIKPAINAEEKISSTELEKLLHEGIDLLSPQRRLVYTLFARKTAKKKTMAQRWLNAIKIYLKKLY